MVVLQLINKVLKTSDASIILNNNLTRDMFIEYENEYDFIMNFYNAYKKVPDKETFLSNFNDFSLIDVNESDEYLLDKINEEYLYSKTVPVVQNVADMLKTDANKAVDYLIKEIPNLTTIQKTMRC